MDDHDLLTSRAARQPDPCSTAAPVIEHAEDYAPESVRFTMRRASDTSSAESTRLTMRPVADGIVWRDSTVAIYWRGKHRSHVHWPSILDARTVHHADSHTEFVVHDGDGVAAPLPTTTARFSLFHRRPHEQRSTLLAEGAQWEDGTLSVRGVLRPCWQVWDRWQPLFEHWNATIREGVLKVMRHDAPDVPPYVAVPLQRQPSSGTAGSRTAR